MNLGDAIPFFVLLALLVVATASHGQPSGCAHCVIRPLDPNNPNDARQIAENKERYERRKRFEKKWGEHNAAAFSDDTLRRIEGNPTDPDCWQYTPQHCY